MSFFGEDFHALGGFLKRGAKLAFEESLGFIPVAGPIAREIAEHYLGTPCDGLTGGQAAACSAIVHGIEAAQVIVDPENGVEQYLQSTAESMYFDAYADQTHLYDRMEATIDQGMGYVNQLEQTIRTHSGIHDHRSEYAPTTSTPSETVQVDYAREFDPTGQYNPNRNQGVSNPAVDFDPTGGYGRAVPHVIQPMSGTVSNPKVQAHDYSFDKRNVDAYPTHQKGYQQIAGEWSEHDERAHPDQLAALKRDQHVVVPYSQHEMGHNLQHVDVSNTPSGGAAYGTPADSTKNPMYMEHSQKMLVK